MESTERTLQLERRVEILEKQVRQLNIQIAELDNAIGIPASSAESRVIPHEVTNDDEQAIKLSDNTDETPVYEAIEEETSDNTPIVQLPFVEEEGPQPIEEIVEQAPLQEEEEVKAEEEKPAPKPFAQPKPQVSWESKIGKKLIPIAGSTLILIALVLFGSLIKPRLTDEMKAIVMAVVSLTITGIGLWKMKPESKYHTFFAALAGCGVSACYISSLVAHFALEVLPETGLMICILCWITALILLSKYKAKMFTYICYIGILIAAAMTVKRWNDSPIGLISYLASIAALFGANFSREYKKVLWFFVQLPIVMVAMSLGYWGDTVCEIIIYATVVTTLVGQTLYYKDKGDSVAFFGIPTTFSIPSITFSCFLLSDRWSNQTCSLLYAATMIGLCIYFYRILIIEANGKSKEIFWGTFLISCLVLPWLPYGEFYTQHFGPCLIPALVTVALGYLTDRKAFTVIGLVFTAFFTGFYPQAYQAHLESGITLDYGCWIYGALLMGLYLISKAKGDTLLKAYTLVSGFWFFIQFCFCNWIDTQLTYLLIVVYCFLLNLKPFQLDKQDLHNKILYVAIMVIGVIGMFFRQDNVFSYHETRIDIPDNIGMVLCNLAITLLLWGMGYWKSNKTLVMISYVILPVMFFSIFDDDILLLALVLYAVMVAAMTYRVIRHRLHDEKIPIAFVCITLLILPWQYKMLSLTETWMLCAISSIVLFLSRFCQKADNQGEDANARVFCLIYNAALLVIGSFLLRYDKDVLYIGHDIEGTKSIVTVLLIILTMGLAAVDMKFLYRNSDSEKERSISIYQGLKFTILFWVILCRFSTVSYIISIIGILLAIAFVTLGFRFRLKSLRLYGLTLSMLCVIKLIFFDIVFDNAVYRAASFLIAGLLLFLISFIYFRLEKKNVANIEAEPEQSDESE